MCVSVSKLISLQKSLDIALGTKFKVRARYKALLEKYKEPYYYLETFLTGLSTEDKIDSAYLLAWEKYLNSFTHFRDRGNPNAFSALTGLWFGLTQHIGFNRSLLLARLLITHKPFKRKFYFYQNLVRYCWMLLYPRNRGRHIMQFAYRWEGDAMSQIIREKSKYEQFELKVGGFTDFYYAMNWNSRELSFEFRTRTNQHKYKRLKDVVLLRPFEKEERVPEELDLEFSEEHMDRRYLLHHVLVRRYEFLERVDNYFTKSHIEFDSELWDSNIECIRAVEYKLATPAQQARIRDDEERRLLWLDLRDVVDKEAASVLAGARRQNKGSLSLKAVKTIKELQPANVHQFFRGVCLSIYTVNIQTGVANIAFWRSFDNRWKEKLTAFQHLVYIRSLFAEEENYISFRQGCNSFRIIEDFRGVYGKYDLPLMEQRKWTDYYLSDYINYFPYYTQIYSWFQKPALAAFYKDIVFGLIGSPAWPKWFLIFTMTRKRKNMYLTVTDMVGKVLLTLSAGAFQIHYRKRANPRALFPLFLKVIECYQEYEITEAVIVMRFEAVYLYRYAARFFKRNNIEVRAVLDRYLVPHNGMKGKRRKRL